MFDYTFTTFAIFLTTLTISLALAFVLKDFLSKIFDATAYIFTAYFTTSIEVLYSSASGINVMIWLHFLIEENCGKKLSHFSIASSIYDLKDGRYNKLNNLWKVITPAGPPSLNETGKQKEEVDEGGDIRKQLDPLQIGQTIFFFYKRTLISVSRNIRPELRNFHMPTELVKITAYGTRSQKLLIGMLTNAKTKMENKVSNHIDYMRADQNDWRLVKRFQPRPLSSVVLKDGFRDALLEDIEEFIKSKEWYKERGIPYRRGYLLHGPPGCGKTSLVKAIAGHIGYDIRELQLSNNYLTDKSLGQLMQGITGKAILLFEDIDAIFVPRVQDEAHSEELDGLLGKLKIRETKNGISFSGLLNVIDGVTSEEDYILFMTTNQIEKLDSALIRPGRIDMRQFIDYPDEQQIAAFFRTFYPDCDDEIAVKFAHAVTKLKRSPSVAQIQGLFLKHKHAPQDNLLDVDSLIEECKKNDGLRSQNIYL